MTLMLNDKMVGDLVADVREALAVLQQQYALQGRDSSALTAIVEADIRSLMD